ncbi:ciliary neurotrophic factor [Hyperolius riggenbachi]|uniref:ciliary neurotrophic factor n=1 Tax=Hyperolius riggenbachi TaxID=752182 RepID=UPI0035A34699
MDSEVALQDHYSRLIQQVHQIKEDLVHLKDKYVEAHGIPHFDVPGGSASIGSANWLELAMEERLLANISAYINLEKRLMQVITDQAESLIHEESELHGGLLNLLENVTALRTQLEYLGATMGLTSESLNGTDDVDNGSGGLFEMKVRGYHVLAELSVWALRSVRDLRKLKNEQKNLASKTESSTTESSAEENGE